MFLVHVLGGFLPIIIVICPSVISISVAQPSLKLINVVFRHGDRTPDDKHEMYPKDPYLNYTFYPEGLGQLTIEGKQRQYQLGKILRDRYKNFLGDVYLPNILAGCSSDYDRTKMSLQLVLAGLFPPIHDRQRWHDYINWQPIPTMYLSRINDNLLLADECPKFLDEYYRVLELPEARKILSQFNNMSKHLTELTGKEMNKPGDWYYLYHTFVAESCLNLTLPEWVYDYYPNGSLFDGIVTYYNLYSYNPLLKRLNGGPIIRAVLDNIKAAQNSTSPKIYLYSGHESNIAAILQAFNLYKPHVPEYSSAIIFELLQQDKQYYVKILYYRGIPPVIDVLTIPGCETLCSFDKFLNLTKDLIPSDEDMICDKRKTEDFADTEYPAMLQIEKYNLIEKAAS